MLVLEICFGRNGLKGFTRGPIVWGWCSLLGEIGNYLEEVEMLDDVDNDDDVESEVIVNLVSLVVEDRWVEICDPLWEAWDDLEENIITQKLILPSTRKTM